MPKEAGVNPRLDEAIHLVNDRAFFAEEAPAARVEMGADGSFRFPSPLPCPFEECNVVRGRLYAGGERWSDLGAVILVHGWNDKPNHYWRFPSMAREFARAGLTAITLELPYHFHRRPRGRPPLECDFLSADILRTALAARQAVMEIRALTRWLAEQGRPKIGLLGVSLGGWLGGLAACHEGRIDGVVLVVPAVRLDRMIDEVAFCQSIKSALGGKKLDLGRLDLRRGRPQARKENVLLLKARHDLFVPPETVEELGATWGGPEIWTLPFGHLSVVGAPGLTRRLLAWLGPRLQPGGRVATRTDSSQDNNAAAGAPPSPGRCGSS